MMRYLRINTSQTHYIVHEHHYAELLNYALNTPHVVKWFRFYSAANEEMPIFIRSDMIEAFFLSIPDDRKKDTRFQEELDEEKLMENIDNPTEDWKV